MKGRVAPIEGPDRDHWFQRVSLEEGRLYLENVSGVGIVCRVKCLNFLDTPTSVSFPFARPYGFCDSQLSHFGRPYYLSSSTAAGEPPRARPPPDARHV